MARRGAKPDTLAKLRATNEERHREALKRGSPSALATERRRQRAAALAADPASGGPAPPAETPPDPPEAAVEPGPGERPSVIRTLWDEGLTGLIRRSR